MRAAPRVTVFIPAHNRAMLVGRAIESVLGQSFQDFEILLVDDGSTDGTPEVIRGYDDPRIRLLVNERNLGIPATRNRGIEHARGEYFATLDSDDEAPVRRLQRQVAFLDRSPRVAMVGGWAIEMDEAGRGLGRLKMLPLSPAELKARLLFRTCHHHSSTMGRTALLREYRYSEAFQVSEDFDLFQRLSERHLLANLPRVFLRRRIHAGRITAARAAQVREMNSRIIARQLDRLGMSYSPEDLHRHFLLLRLKKERITPDREFLEWLAGWLDGLQAANRSSAVYDQRALRGMLGQVWFIACLKAERKIGPSAWRRLGESGLRSGLGSSLSGNIAFAFARNG